MLAEIAIGGTRTGAVVSQLAVDVPQFDPVDFDAFNPGGDLVVIQSFPTRQKWRQLFARYNDCGRDSQTFGTARESTVIEAYEFRAVAAGQQM